MHQCHAIVGKLGRPPPGFCPAGAAIAMPLNGIGGAPNTRSLNLGGFDVHRPASWRGTTRHDCMHAIAFHHEHENFRGPCQYELRWEDDEGYVPTRNVEGEFVADDAGRRPGI